MKCRPTEEKACGNEAMKAASASQSWFRPCLARFVPDISGDRAHLDSTGRWLRANSILGLRHKIGAAYEEDGGDLGGDAVLQAVTACLCSALMFCRVLRRPFASIVV